MNPRIFLIFELVVLFVALPLLIYARMLPNWPIPFLLVVATVAYWRLRRDATFDQSRFWGWKSGMRELVWLLLRNFVLLTILGIGVWLWRPDLLFSLVKRAPLLWMLILIFYPIISVYPQELIYRAYFSHQFRPLLGDGWRMVIASALAFALVHIIFGNWISVALTAIGGILFSLTYRKSGSLLLTCLDHAMFGDFIFTIGLGQFFYHGTRHLNV